MTEIAVSVKDLNYQYSGQGKKVFSNLDLQIQAGQSFGLFGPNGAGKTTLMSLITGMISHTHGEISILGNEVGRKTAGHFGYVPQSLSFYEELSTQENLDYFGAMLGLEKREIRRRSALLLEILGLATVAKKQVNTFSGGMKRRLNLAIGVIHEPPILFLDEPTVGVDVQTRHAIIDYLKGLNKKGTTLFYTSHHLSEAQELCDTVALMDNGSILIHDKLSNLLQQHRQAGLEGLFLKLTGKEFRD